MHSQLFDDFHVLFAYVNSLLLLATTYPRMASGCSKIDVGTGEMGLIVSGGEYLKL